MLLGRDQIVNELSPQGFTGLKIGRMMPNELNVVFYLLALNPCFFFDWLLAGLTGL